MKQGMPERVEILKMGLLLLAVSHTFGCAARMGRDYGSVFFPTADYYRVQRVWPAGDHAPVAVDRLLLLPPVGDVSPALSGLVTGHLHQELQQLIPGAVHIPEQRGAYADYTTKDNLVADDGKPIIEELVQMGRMAGASHVLLIRLFEFRPYPPQRIFMEWTLIDVQQQVARLLLIGGIDAAEQNVLVAADQFLRERRARPYNAENLDFLLRSPREYSSFAVAQAVNALRGHVASQTSRVEMSPVLRARPEELKFSGQMDEIVPK